MTQIAIKNCGMNTPDAVAAAVKSGAHYLGFVIYPSSPRHVEPEKAAKLSAKLPKKVKTVVVLVDPDDAALNQLLTAFRPDFLQLHGSESPERVRQIKNRTKIPVIKAVRVKTIVDVESAENFFDDADMLLFDAKSSEGELPGGTGKAFDWALLKGRQFPLPWFLSGGLTCANVADALRITGAQAVDVSSGIESAPGKKDPRLILQFNHLLTALA